MHYYDDDDREKPSWSEIDKMRDGKKKRKEREDIERNQHPRKTTYAKMKYKKQLEEFFAVGKKKEDRAKVEELKKIKEIKNRNSYMKAADEYIKNQGYPRDLDFLLSMLDHKDSGKISKSMDILEDLYKEETDTRKEMIQQKIHILEMTSNDPKIQGKAEEMLEKMKSM